LNPIKADLLAPTGLRKLRSSLQRRPNELASDEINIGDLVFDNRILMDVGRVPQPKAVTRLL